MSDGSAGRTSSRAARVVRVGHGDELGMAQLVVGALGIVAPLAFLGCASAAGASVSLWLVALVLAAAIVVQIATWALGVTLLWAMLALVWVTQVPGPFSWWSVPGALLAMAHHVGLAQIAGRPSTAPVDRTTLRDTLRRCGVVAGATVAVAATSALVLRLGLDGSAVLLVVAVLAVSAWVWAFLSTDRS